MSTTLNNNNKYLFLNHLNCLIINSKQYDENIHLSIESMLHT